ncbi:MAG: hypothetical protein PWQ54_2434 [Bacteroidales bacterium]|nr:hypothetical protein [Bacteroidales bacterium]
MKKLVFLIFAFGYWWLPVSAQDTGVEMQGEVSYITSVNVYVRFAQTEGLKAGDTLYFKSSGQSVPVLVLTNLSSLSAVGKPLPAAVDLKVGDKLFSFVSAKTASNEKDDGLVKNEEDPVSAFIKEEELPDFPESVGQKEIADTAPKLKADISGRFRVASYSGFSNTEGGNSQKMRYNYAMKARNLLDGNLSLETYLVFSHRNGQWDEIQRNLYNGLKIYDLSLGYKFNDHFALSFGRKINPKLSSVGAIDGLQAEYRQGAFTIGAVGGARPDYRDYSFNFNLAQFGGYISHQVNSKNGLLQTTLSVMEQQNNGLTDRRFLYVQHSNTIFEGLYFFGSAEFELYKKNLDIASDRSALTNLYLILRYKFSRKLSASISFNNRNNIIYYETYKDIVERLLEKEMLQGYNLRLTYKPIKLLTIGVSAGYRERKSDPRSSKNLYSFVSIARIPGTQLSASLSHTYLENAYLKGNILSGMFYQYLNKGRISLGFGYRYVNQSYFDMLSKLKQHMGEINMNVQLTRKLSGGIYYEGTFESASNYHRIYATLSQRF